MRILLGIIGVSAGLIVSCGVYATLLATSMIPRFAKRSGTDGKILLYEDMIIWGTIIGGLGGVYFEQITDWMHKHEVSFLLLRVERMCSFWLLAVIGVCMGIFVGCLAISIAEVLQTIPILARRARLKNELKYVLLAVSVGKMLGAILYAYADF